MLVSITNDCRACQVFCCSILADGLKEKEEVEFERKTMTGPGNEVTMHSPPVKKACWVNCLMRAGRWKLTPAKTLVCSHELIFLNYLLVQKVKARNQFRNLQQAILTKM